MEDTPKENPCLTCGACCARFRVSFYWGETDAARNGKVPFVLTEQITRFRLCMQGTNQKSPRCVALKGKIGTRVTCSIYAHRPSTCREFGIHWEGDKIYVTRTELIRCNQARATWGLPLLPHSLAERGKPRRSSPSNSKNVQR